MTTKSEIPALLSNVPYLTTKNPNSGKMANCKKTPMKIALMFLSCIKSMCISTVADMPNTRQNRRAFPAISLKDNMMFCGVVCNNGCG